jgi:hypothetical protein
MLFDIGAGLLRATVIDRDNQKYLPAYPGNYLKNVSLGPKARQNHSNSLAHFLRPSISFGRVGADIQRYSFFLDAGSAGGPDCGPAGSTASARETLGMG